MSAKPKPKGQPVRSLEYAEPNMHGIAPRPGVHDAIPIGGDLRRDRALVINFVDWAERPQGEPDGDR